MNDYKFYLNLTESESIEFAKKSLAEITNKDRLEDILLHLALFTDGKCLKPLYPFLIDKKIFYPSEIYIHADEKIADELIKMIETGDGNANHLLTCLAWIGTRNVIDFFVTSSTTKTDWTQQLYVLPNKYAEQAGWIIDGNLEKQYLISNEVSVFTKKDSSSSKKNNSESQTFVESSIVCKFCKNNVTRVFQNEIDSALIPFITCLLCCAYEPFFMNVINNGNVSWNSANKKWKHFDEYDLEIRKVEENTLVITDERRKPEFAINQFIAISRSQIGGYPTWVQDAEYLSCPNCKNTMQYIGQIDMEDVEDYGEGIYYFHFCGKCKITGTNYQQT